jgi:hypothetical protein
MKAAINGTEIYFDIEGAGLVADGPDMTERPVVFMLHGGPGGDHVSLRASMSGLSEFAQLVYVDHRGSGRSQRCDISTNTLDQNIDGSIESACSVCRTAGWSRRGTQFVTGSVSRISCSLRRLRVIAFSTTLSASLRNAGVRSSSGIASDSGAARLNRTSNCLSFTARWGRSIQRGLTSRNLTQPAVGASEILSN